MLILQLLVLICLGFIFYQDLKYRAVYWICFPVLAGCLFFLKQREAGLADSLADSAWSISFFAVQLLLLWGYFSIKNKKAINLTSNYLGLGDVLFLIAVAFYLSPVSYILFYVGSLILVLIYTLLQRGLAKNSNPQIPLAGLQALLFAIALSVSLFKPTFNLYNDFWLYGL
jgi:hypothetical protein